MRLAVALAALVVAGCGPAPRPALGQLPPDARLYDRDAAGFVPATRYKGHVVVLDFWAGWCAECKRSVPQVQRLAAAFARDGLIVVGVNAGDTAADAAVYARELGIDYPIALDPELALSDRIAAGKLPMLVVVDRDGTIVHRASHVDRATIDVVRRLLRSAAASSPSSPGR